MAQGGSPQLAPAGPLALPAGAALVPAAVSLFVARFPDVELTVLEAEPEESVPMLRAGELELAIVGQPIKSPEGFGELYHGIDLDHLLDEPRYALLPSGHRLARRKRLRLGDLAGEVRIELGRSPTRQARVYLAPTGEPDSSPSNGFRSDDFNVVQGMVAAGAGIAVVPELALTNLRTDITVHHLGASAPMRSVAATLADTHRSPATSAMLQLLVEVAERWPRDYSTRVEEERNASGDSPLRRAADRPPAGHEPQSNE